MPSLGPILWATVAVPDLDRAVASYQSLLGLATLDSGSVADGPWCLVGPPKATWGAVRLLEVRGAPIPPTFRTLGWSAVEILVADADATYERCRREAGFDVLQQPITVGAEGALRALQVRGPGGEGIYLTQVLRQSDRFQLPSLEEGEHRVYVVVAGARDVDGFRQLLHDTFGVPHITDHRLPVKVLNQAYGLPPDSLHRLSTVQLAGSTIVEIDEYPAGAVSRPSGSAGIRSITFAGSVHGDAGAPGTAVRMTGGDGLDFEVVSDASALSALST